VVSGQWEDLHCYTVRATTATPALRNLLTTDRAEEVAEALSKDWEKVTKTGP